MVIVNYNGERWLPQCLASLSTQDYALLELVVVDNASTDESLTVARTNFPAAKIVLNETNLGFAGGVNAGISVAQGELVMLLNTDAWCASTTVSALVAAKSALGVDVVAPHESSYDGTVQLPTLFLIDPLGHPYFRPRRDDDTKPDFYLSGACLLFGRQMYLDTGGLDQNFFMYCEEVDWFWRLQLLGKSFAYAPGVTVFHASYDSAPMIRPDVFLWRNQNTLQMLLKNYSWPALTIVIPLFILQALTECGTFFAIGRRDIARTYLAGLAWNARHLARTLEQRRIVQATRRCRDFRILRRMYPAPAKLAHARSYVTARRNT